MTTKLNPLKLSHKTKIQFWQYLEHSTKMKEPSNHETKQMKKDKKALNKTNNETLQLAKIKASIGPDNKANKAETDIAGLN